MATEVKNIILDHIVESVSLNHEHIENVGEDANPIARVSAESNCGILGAFDGMGGAGSSKCTTENGETHTEAYLASRIVRDIVEYMYDINDFEGTTSTILEHQIKTMLDIWKERLGIKKGGLRSSIIRRLPTTMAICTWSLNEKLIVNSFWAGDSRNYALSINGLQQLSLDHVKGDRDAMTTLHNDPPMSNCISQSNNFYIEKNTVEFNHPVILISCTDGCFGYLDTPMGFEQMLLSTLKESESIDDWKNKICEYLIPVSGDDFSFAIQMIGTDFNTFKRLLEHREMLINKMMDECDEERSNEIWEIYSKEFEKLINK